MKLEQRQSFVEEMAENISSKLKTDMTIIILNSDLGMEATSDGFNPEENPERLELFMALLLGLVQQAIDSCGADYKIIVEHDGMGKDLSETIRRLKAGLAKKLN